MNQTTGTGLWKKQIPNCTGLFRQIFESAKNANDTPTFPAVSGTHNIICYI